MIIKKPSKKIIVLIVCALVIISLAVYSKIHTNSKTITVQSSTEQEQYTDIQYSNETDAEKNISALDTDGDGLPDWQEIITNTDPHNTDTDGDGTPDGKELDLGRDPTIAGPNDKLDNSKLSKTSDESTTTPTISEQISKNLFANAVYLSNNDSMTSDNVDTLVGNLVNGVQNNFTFKEYLANNLPITVHATTDDIRFFASVFATLQMQLLNNLSTNSDPEALAKIYGDHAQSLYETKTPSDIADTELQVINNFSEVSSAFDAFSKQEQDPFKLPLAVKAYQDAGSTQSDLVIKIGEYLNKNGIIDLLDDNARNYWTLVITQ
ncbi:MAG: hypothetical protein V4469_03665 [Patescibacteria group bacterium]